MTAPKNPASEAEREIFRDPVKRRAWVQFQLKIRGLSFAEIARQQGVVPQAVSAALGSNSLSLEEAIASAVERPVRVLFPERFTSDGRRLGITRTRNRSSLVPAHNVENGGAL